MSHCGVMANMWACDIAVIEFDIRSLFNVRFLNKTLRKL